ncbi:MAG: transposase [Treponema sp.]|nr:transposase [Treponema sp.]
MLTDRAYEGGRTRVTAGESGYKPVVPPKRNRAHPWKYDKERYKRRKEIERFLRRLKGFRGIRARYDKLARIFSVFIYPACACIALRCVNTP